MPEIKHNFTGGRMNKDLDERLVPNGEYRDAMNIQVSTSEGSDVGAIENILGNEMVPFEDGFTIPMDARVIGSIADEKIDTLYWLVWTPNVDYIFSYKRGDAATKVIFRDINKNALMFSMQDIITGINVIDDMLFWTDNKTEPKKISIPRSVIGTPPNTPNAQTQLVNSDLGTTTNVDIEEKHITVIKKTPPTPLEMVLKTSRLPGKIYTGVITTGLDTGGGALSNNTSFQTSQGTSTRYNFQGISSNPGSNTFIITITEGVNSFGDVVSIGPIGSADPINPGLTGWHSGSGTGQAAIPVGTPIVFKSFNDDKSIANPYGTPPGLPVTSHVIRGVVADAYPPGSTNAAGVDISNLSTYAAGIKVRVTSIDGYPPIATSTPFGTSSSDPFELKYVVDLFEQKEKLFEFKFPRFSYRYKYEDGEYSPFAPFTQVAFSPGSFDYHPRKGYNLGMVNRLSSVRLGKFINAHMPKDVVSVDILFKDEPSPNVYIVDTISPNDDTASGGTNTWDTVMLGGYYEIDKETISSVTPSNQLLRPWDNVPRKALAQSVTGSRVVYGNYVQNYNLITENGKKYFAEFNVDWVDYPDQATDTNKSIKSLREYQLGVVFIDKYGRETPVISNKTGTKGLEKSYADKNNRIKVNMIGDKFPQDLTHFKFFVKETADQYYNMAMDRWYNAEDGNIWLAFPSSDRNKIDIDTFLILKKGTDADVLVKSAARYKVIAIENEAPDFIKTSKNKISKIKHAFGNDTTDLFGDGPVDIPSVNADEFKVRYEPFLNSTGRDLHSIKEDLYVEFGKHGTFEVSNRYKISSITNNWDGTIEEISNAQYSIKLEKKLKNDVNFISDDLTGGNVNKIESGALMNIYKYKVEDKPQFDGRFFVKIYYDEVFRTNISAIVAGSDEDLVVIDSKRVYGLNKEHVKMHTGRVGRCHINGAETYNGKNYWDENVGFQRHGSTTSQDNFNGSNNGWLSRTEMAHGYYLDDVFSSFALYFRRYQKGNNSGYISETLGVYDHGPLDVDASVQQAINDNIPAPSSTGGPLTGSFEYYPLHYLQAASTGNNNPTNYKPHAAGNNAGTVASENWEVTDGSANEYGVNANHKFGGMTANFSFFGNPNSGGALGGIFDGNAKGYIECGHDFATGAVYNNATNDFTNYVNSHTTFDSILEADNARETEVWFIDNGPKVGKSFLGDDLKFGYRGEAKGDTSPRDSGISKINGAGNGAGILLGSNDYNMEIGFGGIRKVDGIQRTTDNFFNVGDWSTSSQDAANSEYGNLENFVNNFQAGSQFRWLEDPNQTVYTIGGSVTSEQKLRHSYRRNRTYHMDNKDPFIPTDKYSMVSSERRLYNEEDDQGRGMDGVYGNMAESLPFNFTKNWTLGDITPNISTGWNPELGEWGGVIENGLSIVLNVCNSTGGTTGGFNCTGADVEEDLKIFVTSIAGPDATTGTVKKIHVGMALTRWQTKDGSAQDVNYPIANNTEYYIVRHIIEHTTPNYFELWLGGYIRPLTNTSVYDVATHELLESVRTPRDGSQYTFSQVAVNGYSPNSEFNINTMGQNFLGDEEPIGAVVAVGYTLEFIGVPEPEEVLSENPAIFETEPKDVKDLDIYYEATASIPINIDDSNIQDAIPIGSLINQFYTVTGYNGSILEMSSLNANFALGTHSVARPDGLEFSVNVLSSNVSNIVGVPSTLTVEPFLYNSSFNLPWHNCFSFGNGVESNRIRDNFNLAFIANGVKASTTLEQEYKEEHRKYGLIYSGLYNSTSGVNNLNQFIAAEKITKDVNPIYGSIQKLHSRDSDLVTLCEDKVLRILANKDAVFNADGNTNLTATANVLGQTVPFAGEYGISTNPESFASESYRVYFSDKIRGTIMRLSRDGLTPISDHGMKDWFKDNLRLSTKIFGSHDDKKGEYNVTLQGYESKTVSFKEDVKGWVSFKSFIPENAISMANDYYTFENGKPYVHHVETVDRNVFYNKFGGSDVTVVLNDNPSYIKEFNTLNYEGSQAKVKVFQEELRDNFDGTTSNYNDQEYYNLATKLGWHVKNVETNEEDGRIDEFLEKEGKWFNYIKREINLNLSKADTGDFSFQGIGFAGNITGGGKGSISGCTDRTATNFDPLATIDDGSCVYGEVYGCMDVTATNYNSEATIDDGSCVSVPLGVLGCTDPLATNFDPLATIDNGTCIYAPPIQVVGCMDPLATNYNSLATVDSGNCVYATPIQVVGCMDPLATNYDPQATVDSGNCVYTTPIQVVGCMDPKATNYNPQATVDSGRCTYATYD